MTQDLDLWVGRAADNAARLQRALDEFGAPIGDEGARRFSELSRQMVRIGAPPNLVDILNFAANADFAMIYEHRVHGALDKVEVDFPSREDLIKLKRAAGRPQDLADIERLESS